MPLQKQLIPLVLSGLDQKADPRASVPGKMVLVENAYQQRSGEWRKREGLNNRGSTVDSGTLNPTKRLASNGAENLLLTDAALFSYSTATSAWRNSTVNVRTFSHSLKGVVADAYDQVTPDCAYGSSLLVTTWRNKGQNNGSYNYQIYDASLVPIGVPGQINGDSGNTRVMHYGGYFLFAYVLENNPGSSQVYTVRMTASTRAVAAANLAFNVAATGVATPYMDAMARTDNGYAVLCSVVSAGTLRTGQWNISTNAVATAAVDYTMSGAPGTVRSISILEHDQSDGFIYVAVACSGTGVRLVKMNATTLAVSAEYAVDTTATAARTVCGVVSGSTVYLWYEEAASATANNFVTAATISTTGAGASTATFLEGCGLTSKSFVCDSQRCLAVTHKGAISTVTMVVGAPLSSPAACTRFYARIAADRTNGLSDKQNAIAGVATLSSTQSLFPICTRTSVSTNSAGTTFYSLSGVNNVTLTSGFDGIGRPLDIGRGTLIPGSMPRLYDGQKPLEAGWHVPPEAPSTSAVAGGSLTVGATYQFVAVWAWYDAQGNLHRSAPSPAASYTPSGGNQTVQLAGNGYWFGERFAGTTGRWPTVEIYMTDANGSIFYKTGIDTVTLSAGAAYTKNIGSFVGATAEPLYTTGDVLDNLPPPPSKVFAAHRGKVYAINMDDPYEIWGSKDFRAGLGVSFSDTNIVRHDDNMGGFTALASLDDKLIAFKDQAIFAITGDGPNDLGQGTWDIQRVAGGVGTSNPMSVVVTPEGVMFESDKGIYLLTRGLDCVYVGGPVEDYNSLTIVGSTVLADKNQARWVTSEGRLLVYDWHWSRLRGEPVWYTYTGYSGVDCVIWSDQFAIVSSSGTVKFETAGQYHDEGAVISSKWITTWLSFAQLAGWQRVYQAHVVGEDRGDHTLTVQLAYNAVDSNYETFSKDLSSLTFTTPPEDEYRFVCKPKLQQCTSLRVTIYDTPASGGTEGFRLTGVSFVVGQKPGGFRTGNNRLLTPS